MPLDIRSVELFVRVAALGAIGKAGAEFGLSPTAATQRIQTLETAVGAQLLNRTTRAVALSADGEVFLAHAKRIISDVEDALADVSGDARSIKGELRITGSASFGRRHIAPYVAEFLAAHPQVSIQLHLSDAVVDIIEQGFDLAIRVGTLVPSTLKARKLAVNPRALVASPDYLERHGVPECPADLKSHNCLMLGEARIWSLIAPDGTRTETRVSGNFSATYGEALTEAALTGLGIALKSRWDVVDYLDTGALVQLLDTHTPAPLWNVWAVRPPSRLTGTSVVTSTPNGILKCSPGAASAEYSPNRCTIATESLGTV